MSTTTIDRHAATAGGLVRRSLWMRGGAVLLALLWVALVWVAGAFFTVASPVGGWFYATLCFLPGLVGTAVMFGFPRWRALLVATAAALFLGTVMHSAVPPDHARIHNVAEDVGAPEGWQRVDTDERGNTWCWKGCPEVTYYFEADGPAEQAMADVAAQLEGAGWEGGEVDPNPVGQPSEYDPLAAGEWRDGRWRARVRVPSAASAPWWPTGELPPSPTTTAVEVTFSAR